MIVLVTAECGQRLGRQTAHVYIWAEYEFSFHKFIYLYTS